VEWMHLARYRGQWQVLMNTGNKPSGSVKGGEFLV
jgi:hypothetical protein